MGHNFKENLGKIQPAIKEQVKKLGWENPGVVLCEEPRKGSPCIFRIDDKEGMPIGRVGFSYEDLDDLLFETIRPVLLQLNIFNPPMEQFMERNGYDLRFVERSWKSK